MRRNPPRPPKRYVVQYRIMFLPKVTALGAGPWVGIPGIIKGNRPRAEKFLASFLRDGFDAWLEVKRTADSEWEKLESESNAKST